MKMLSGKVDDLHSRYVDNLQKALDLEREISKQRNNLADKAIDPQMAEEFRRHLKQTEGHFKRLENLLHQSTGEAA